MRIPSYLGKSRKVISIVITLLMIGALAALPCATQGQQDANVRSDEASRILYIANMEMIQREWERNDYENVTRLLTETSASKERHFEWYYWHRLCFANTQLLQDPPPARSIRDGRFSPDGTRLALCGDSKEAYLWDTSTHKRLFTLQGHERLVFCLAFSPDGKLLATGSGDNTVKIWEVSTGRLFRTIHNTGDGFASIYSVSFSSSGKHVATGSLDGATKVWDVSTGNELLAIPRPQIGDTAHNVAFSPDDKQIVTCSESGAQLRDARNGRLLFALYSSPLKQRVHCYASAFSKDGSRLLLSRGDYLERLTQTDVWNTSTGEKLFSLPTQEDVVYSAAFSPDGSTLVTAGSGGEINTFDGKTGVALQSITAPCRCVAFSADGARIYAGAETYIKTFATHNLADTPTIHGDDGDFEILALSPDHKSMATAGFVFRDVHLGAGKAEIKVWDVGTGRVRFTMTEHVGSIEGLFFSQDGKRILSGGEDGKAIIWDSATGKRLVKIDCESINGIAYSPDNKRILTGKYDGTATLWDAANGRKLMVFKGHHGRLESVAFSPDGKLIATNSYDNTVKIWEASTAKELHTFRGTSSFAVFSPDSRSLLTSNYDRRVAELWSVKTFDKKLTLYGGKEGVTGGSFSADGKRIVTANDDGTARVYDVTTGREVLSLKHKRFVNSAVFSADMTEIVTVSGSETVQVWPSAYQPH